MTICLADSDVSRSLAISMSGVIDQSKRVAVITFASEVFLQNQVNLAG